MAYPHLSRAERHNYETLRLATISLAAKLIKLADIKDNTRNVREVAPAFATVYLAAKRHVVPFLRVEGAAPHEALFTVVAEQVAEREAA